MSGVAPGSSSSHPLLRPSARVILLDPEDRVLLFRVQDADADGAMLDAQGFWITPGGGIEGDETYEQCARRELREETGIEDFELGPCVWLREHTWRWGDQWIRSQERYFLGRTAHARVARLYQTDVEMQFLADHRWWSLDDLQRANERLVPADFAALMEPLLRGECPPSPVPVGE